VWWDAGEDIAKSFEGGLCRFVGDFGEAGEPGFPFDRNGEGGSPTPNDKIRFPVANFLPCVSGSRTLRDMNSTRDVSIPSGKMFGATLGVPARKKRD